MDNSTAKWQADQNEALQSAKTEADFFATLAAAARALGFDYCAYGMRMPLPLSNPKTFLLSNYPHAWQQRYASEGYLAIDPTVAHGTRSVAPLVWAEATFNASPSFWDDAWSHGIKVGWAQSSYDAKGTGGMLTLARSHDAISAAELFSNSMRMSWLVQAAHEGMSRLLAAQHPIPAPVVLTPREIEVLRWTADGKTAGEVGAIMAITERTVNFHINNCLDKLGAANKTAGVIRALMLRLL